MPLTAGQTHSKVQSNALSPPEFQLALARASTPTSLLLPNQSNRYRALLQKAGSTVEISPEAQSYASDFASRISGTLPNMKESNVRVLSSPPPQKPKPSGAALILDYGPSATVPISTFRGIRAHKRVSPFILPGQVDLSADVDFVALAEAALNASQGIEVHGPVEQGRWLQEMGIRERAGMLCRSLQEDEAGRKRITGAVDRLVERGGGSMGKLYKVMAIVPERRGKRPIGFGGDVE